MNLGLALAPSLASDRLLPLCLPFQVAADVDRLARFISSLPKVVPRTEPSELSTHLDASLPLPLITRKNQTYHLSRFIHDSESSADRPDGIVLPKHLMLRLSKNCGAYRGWLEELGRYPKQQQQQQPQPQDQVQGVDAGPAKLPDLFSHVSHLVLFSISNHRADLFVYLLFDSCWQVHDEAVRSNGSLIVVTL